MSNTTGEQQVEDQPSEGMVSRNCSACSAISHQGGRQTVLSSAMLGKNKSFVTSRIIPNEVQTGPGENSALYSLSRSTSGKSSASASHSVSRSGTRSSANDFHEEQVVTMVSETVVSPDEDYVLVESIDDETGENQSESNETTNDGKDIDDYDDDADDEDDELKAIADDPDVSSDPGRSWSSRNRGTSKGSLRIRIPLSNEPSPPHDRFTTRQGPLGGRPGTFPLLEDNQIEVPVHNGHDDSRRPSLARSRSDDVLSSSPRPRKDSWLASRAQELLAKKPLPPLPVQSRLDPNLRNPDYDPLSDAVFSPRPIRSRFDQKKAIPRIKKDSQDKEIEKVTFEGDESKRKSPSFENQSLVPPIQCDNEGHKSDDSGVNIDIETDGVHNNNEASARSISSTKYKSDDEVFHRVQEQITNVNSLGVPPPEIRIQKSSTIGQDSSFYSSAGTPSTDYGVSISDSEEFDTDLENEKVVTITDTYVGKVAYEKSCKELRSAPQNVIYKHLDSPVVSLKHRNLGPISIKALTTALVKNVRVTNLELEDTGLGSMGAYHVAQLLMENENINHLNIADNNIGPQGTTSLSEMMCYNKGLTYLNMSGNRIGEFGGETLAVAIANNVYLYELDISKNDLGEMGGIMLGKALVQNETIRKLDCSWNHFRTKGAVALFKGLQKNSGIIELDVSWNGLGYEGSLAMSNMMKKNNTITHINATNNRINWQGALLLTKGIKANVTIMELKLGFNPLTTTGGLDIIQAISENQESAIKYLSLENVPVVGEFEMIASMLTDTRQLRYEHGGIVNSHDVLGMRVDKRIDPMQRVINYMKEKELRVTELFRGMDKSVGNRLDAEEFDRRLRKAGIAMPRYEVEELIHYIATRSKSKGDDDINISKMMKGVSQQIRKERIERIKARESEKRLKSYHKKILTDPSNLPQGVDEYLSGAETKSQVSMGSKMSARTVSPLGSQGILGSLLTNRGSPGTPTTFASGPLALTQSGLLKPPVTATPRKTGVMSMSGGLGKKPKEFGTTSIRKKKKKKMKARK